jgi:alpha-L-rhamnosidase
MNPRRVGRFFLLLVGVVGLAAHGAFGALTPTRLRCEYRENPAGIGETAPRLGWGLEAAADARGVRQTAYRILVASTPELLAAGRGDLWDTGKVASDATQQIVYAGKPLGSRQQCWWQVRVWDEAGRESAWSAPARWSMGLLPPASQSSPDGSALASWQAQWIGLDTPAPTDGSELSDEARARLQRQPWAYVPLEVSKTAPLAAFVRGVLTLPPEKKLVRAALAFSPDQVCTVTVNGQPAGAVTRWEQMRPVDLTATLVPGENAIGLAITQYDGYRPALLGEVELEFADGSAQVVPIDATWKFAPTAAVGWDRPGFDAVAWLPLLVEPRRVPWEGPPQTFTYYQSPAPFLRKAFTVAKPVRRATLYSTALGVYELHLNGARVGRDQLAPGWTEFRSRVQYQTYDVTAQVRPGANALGAILGDGWYASVLSYTGQRYFYGGYPRLLAQLEIEYTDGTRETIASDGTWRAATGPIRSADLMAGCVYDARLRRDDWAQPGFDAAAWQPVATGRRARDAAKPLPAFAIEAANADAARVTEERPARTVTEPRPGAWTFDLGQIITGWVRLKVQGRPGQKLMVRHGEMLNPNGTLYTSNLRGANATDVYFLRGDGVETLEPFFTFHGFRYVEVTGLDAKPALDAVTGVVVHSPMERTGEFECSSPLVNQLVRNIAWSQRDNFLEVPTDCPQRDERAGWTGDAQFFIGTAAYNADVAAFFTRWLTTVIQDSQLPSGAIANVAPKFGSLWASAGWGGDAAIICVHTIYRAYGDTRIVERNFDALARYLAWLGRRPEGGRTHAAHARRPPQPWGRRQPRRAPARLLCAPFRVDGGNGGGHRPHGRRDRYRAQSEEAKAAFQRDFILPDGSIKESSQTGYALAFTMDLVPAELRTKVAEKFVEEIKKRDWHLATGFIGTPRLLPGLHLAGRDDVAYRLLLAGNLPLVAVPGEERRHDGLGTVGRLDARKGVPDDLDEFVQSLRLRVGGRISLPAGGGHRLRRPGVSQDRDPTGRRRGPDECAGCLRVGRRAHRECMADRERPNSPRCHGATQHDGDCVCSGGRAGQSHRGWPARRACSWSGAVERGKRRRGFPCRLGAISIRIAASMRVNASQYHA